MNRSKAYAKSIFLLPFLLGLAPSCGASQNNGSSLYVEDPVYSLYGEYVWNAPKNGDMPLGYGDWLSSTKGNKENLGSSFLIEKEVPNENEGKNGDSALNLSTYDLYLKKEGSWEKITNIKKDDRPTWASVDIQNKKYFQENCILVTGIFL